MSMRGHETVDHTADMGIRGWGQTREQAFEEIAAAMFELTVDAAGCAPSKRIAISCMGKDLTELLLEFLNGLISQADVSGTILFKVSVEAVTRRDGGWTIGALAEGVPVAEIRDRLLVEVKAATYYGAVVREREPGIWVAQCVVDL